MKSLNFDPLLHELKGLRPAFDHLVDLKVAGIPVLSELSNSVPLISVPT